jgi:uncharacterized membrane protein
VAVLKLRTARRFGTEYAHLRMKSMMLIPRLLLFLFFVPVAVFIAVFPYSLVQFLAYQQRRREYVQLWRNMWRWTIGAPARDDEKPGMALLVGLGVLAMTAVIVVIRMVY